MVRRRNPYFAAGIALIAAAGLLSVDALAQSEAPRVERVHESLSHAVSNGCDWQAELDGTLAGQRSVTADMRIGSGIRCPNGQSAHTAMRRVQLSDATPDEVAHALERALGVSSVDGSDRCNYVPSLRVAHARVESTGVGVACVPGRDDAGSIDQP